VAVSSLPPFVDPRLDLGLYAMIDHGRAVTYPRVQRRELRTSETMQLLKEWGYGGGAIFRALVTLSVVGPGPNR
jgi:hypothetical protein